ncbi:MAG: hypothetical protein J6033_07280 [Lachnospiraceae bacterium]|nr:hypothetical protein [Lachnospiraceae bacterium]
MDKYEYKVKADEIKSLIEQGEYARAAEIADEIDWRRVKSVMMLCTISDLYKMNRRYEDARDVLKLAYDRRPGGRNIVYSLCELSIKTEEFVQAIEYYKEFVQIAPKDTGRYILQYKIYEAQDVSLEERIQVLEELKKRDYRERWAYELAYLYHRVGLATKCVEECDELILWFGDGKYVIKAMELKMLHQPLTPAQKKKYESRFGSNPMEDFPSTDTKVYAPVSDEEADEEQPEISVNVGEYNTINLQEALAENIKEVLGADEGITKSIIAPMLESDTESLDTARIEEVNEDDMEENALESTEVFFGDGGESLEAALNAEADADEMDADDEDPDIQEPEDHKPEVGDETENKKPVEIQREGMRVVMPENENRFDNTAEIIAAFDEDDNAGREVMEQMRLEQFIPDGESIALHAEPPKEMAEVLTEDPDGQMRIVMPEVETVEKQITGQLSIEDILAEWERMKKESEEKRAEEVRRHVLEETGAMFTEFEASIRDGLLEKLESEADREIAEGHREAAKFEVTEPEGDFNGDEEAEERAALAKAASEIAEAVSGVSKAGSVAAEATVAAVSAAEVAELTESFDGDDSVEELEEINEEEDVPADDAEESFDEEETFEDADEDETLEAEESDEVSETEEAESVDEELNTADEEPSEIADEAEADEEVSEELSKEAEDVSSEDETVEDETSDGETADNETSETETSETETSKDAEAEEVSADASTEDADPEAEKIKEAQEAESIRALTDEEKTLYAPYIQSKKARHQLAEAIDNISLAAYTGNLVISGDEGTDIITLAKNIIKEIQLNDNNFSGKVAKISGASLNRKDVEELIGGLSNGAIIIQKAGQIDAATAKALHKALQKENFGIVVILEDTKKNINSFFDRFDFLKDCFNAKIEVEALSNDTLVAFGRQYARSREYSIDEMGVLALHTRIEELQTSDHAANVLDVKAIVDEAIVHANKKSVGHIFDMIMSKRYDDEDMIILGEKDFA